MEIKKKPWFKAIAVFLTALTVFTSLSTPITLFAQTAISETNRDDQDIHIVSEID